MKLLSSFILFLLMVNFLRAGPFTWIGGTGDWNVKQNWDQGAIPGFGDVVIIPSGTNNVTIPSGYTAKPRSIELRAFSTLTVKGELIVKATGDYGIWCKGKLKLGSEALLEVHGNINNTFGLWVDGGMAIFNPDSEINLSSLKHGISIEFGKFSNEGIVRISDIKDLNSAIHLNFQSTFINQKLGQVYFRKMSCAGLNLFTGTSKAYNYGLIEAQDDFDFYVVQLLPGSQLFNNDGGEIIAKSSDYYYSVYNSGEIFNSGKMDIHSGAGVLCTGGYLHNESGGSIEVYNQGGTTEGIVLYQNINGPAAIVNEGVILVRDLDSYTLPLAVNYNTTVTNSGTFIIQNLTGASGMKIFIGGSFNNVGGALHLKTNASDLALIIDSGGELINSECGEMIVEQGDLEIEGDLINDAWIYLEDDMTDIIIQNSAWVNNGLVIDPFELLDGLNGFDNQGIVFDPLGPAPVYPGPFIQDVFTIGDFDGVSHISWHLTENGPSAGVFLIPSNQVSLYNNTIGAQSLWLDVTLDNCSNVWVEFFIQGGVQAPPPPPTQQPDAPMEQTDWSVFPNPAFGPLEITTTCKDCGQLDVQILNSVGQVVDRQVFQPNGFLQVNRPSHLPAGWYYLQIRSGGELLHAAPVVWQ